MRHPIPTETMMNDELLSEWDLVTDPELGKPVPDVMLSYPSPVRQGYITETEKGFSLAYFAGGYAVYGVRKN